MVKSRLQNTKSVDSLPALVDSGRYKNRDLLLPNHLIAT